ncbi:MAG: DUF6493 family protein [Nocardioidaceae bacterium]
MTLTYAAVEARVLDGDNEGVRDLLHGATEAERRACAAEVAALAKVMYEGAGWSNGRWRATTAAVVGCTGGAAAVAKVLLRRGADEVAMDVLVARAPSWLPDLLERLAAADDPWGQQWPATERLRVALGAPYPLTDTYLRGLVGHVGTDDLPILDRLRADPELLALVPRLLRVPDVHVMMARSGFDEVRTDGPVQRVARDPERTWEGTIATLTRTGELDRGEILETVLGLLLAGGKREHVAWALALHDRLQPDREEVADRARTYLRLLADGPGPVATAAQRALREVDAEGRLELDALLETSRAVLHRREKGLVTAQLRWLAQVARRCPDRSADVAESVAAAFGHEKPELQERALAIVTGLLPGLGEESRARLGAAAEDLAPVVRLKAGDLLPPEPVDLPAGPPVLTGAPVPAAPAPAAVRDATQLAEVVAAAHESPDPMLLERVLDGTARLANADRATFARALAPLRERVFATPADRPWFWLPHLLLVNVLRFRPRRRSLLGRFSAPPYRLPSPEGPHTLTMRRVGEVVAQVYDGQARALLALPTAVSGHVDAAALVHRCAELEERGEQPWPVDLEQALLRLPRKADPAAVAAAATLHSPAGRAVHTRLVQGPPADPVLTVVTGRARHPRPRWGNGDTERDVVLAALPPGGWPAGFGIELAHPLAVAGLAHWGEPVADCRMLLLSLPSHREVAAAFALAHATAVRTRLPADPRETLAALPVAEGPAGPAVHLLVGYAACAPDAVGRTVAVDAMLALADRGALDGEQLARALTALGETGDAIPGRLAQTLGDVARASRPGATLVHATLSALVPPLLAGRTRGTHALLAVGAEAALASGARGTVEGLDTVADSGGSSRLVAEARRWRDLLAGTS